MQKISSFIRREPVFTIALLAAVISCLFVPPDPEYLEYIDFRTIALLYSLMAVVAGLRRAGVLTALANALCRHAGSIRSVGIVLVCLCFFSSMLITNDVALLTFVPFAIVVLGLAGRRQDLIRVIVLQTIAANLGSMLTPVGNPQNLYLYSFYNIPFFDFLSMTFPVWCLSLVLLILVCLFLPSSPIGAPKDGGGAVSYKALWAYSAMFVICLLTVVRIIDWPVMLAAVLIALFLYDRQILLQADFTLLLTFAAFFIFAGNLARIDAIDNLLKALLAGREYWIALLSSQAISNVPAALLLSGFTGNAKALLCGVDIGGLGTPIASLASLISLKLYAQTAGARLGKYLLVFTAANLLFLLLLSAFWLVAL